MIYGRWAFKKYIQGLADDEFICFGKMLFEHESFNPKDAGIRNNLRSIDIFNILSARSKVMAHNK